MCEPGYYLNNGTCAQCATYPEPYYCPGDDIRYNCPAYEPDAETELLSGGTVLQRHSIWSSSPLSSNSVGCHGDILIQVDIGRYLAECTWNGKNYYEACNNAFLWYYAADGYYLNNFISTSWNDWYANVSPCTNAPANAHYTGAGTPNKDGSSGNDCPWLCDDGFGQTTAGTCAPLCDGQPKLRTDNIALNIYSGPQSHPGLAIQYKEQVCYVNMVPGKKSGAINLEYSGNIYHLAD